MNTEYAFAHLYAAREAALTIDLERRRIALERLAEQPAAERRSPGRVARFLHRMGSLTHRQTVSECPDGA